MTVRRATDKERRKYGKAWLVSSRRNKPITASTPPLAPWSYEAIAAYDAAAVGRDLPPMVALKLRRIDSGALRGVFDLYVTHWHYTFFECRWFVSSRKEWVGLPNSQYTDRHGRKHYKECGAVDDVYAQRFCDAALEALHQEVARAQAVAAKSAAEDDQPPQRPLGNGAAVHVEGDPDDIPF